MKGCIHATSLKWITRLNARCEHQINNLRQRCLACSSGKFHFLSDVVAWNVRKFPYISTLENAAGAVHPPALLPFFRETQAPCQRKASCHSLRESFLEMQWPKSTGWSLAYLGSHIRWCLKTVSDDSHLPQGWLSHSVLSASKGPNHFLDLFRAECFQNTTSQWQS